MISSLIRREIQNEAPLRRGMIDRFKPVVPRDGPSGWFVPQRAEHFAALGLPIPDYLWLCQETSGNLNNEIGAALPLAAVGTPLYGQTIAGWSRKFIGSTYDVQGGFSTTSALLDLAAGESFAMPSLLAYEAPALTTRNMTTIAAAAFEHVASSSPTGFIRSRNVGGNVNSLAVHASAGAAAVHQICKYRNATANLSGTASELESIVNPHDESAFTGQVKGINSGAGADIATTRIGWHAIYKGAKAERNWSMYFAKLRGSPEITRDGPNGWYIPQTAEDFRSLGLPVPDWLWLCQELSGNLSPALGSAVTLLSTGTPLYQQSITGWTRKFVGSTYDVQGGFLSTAIALDMSAGQSVATVDLLSFETPATLTRTLSQYGTGTNISYVNVNHAASAMPGRLRAGNVAGSANGTIDHSSLGAATVRQMVHYRNATSNVSGIQTDLESITTTHDESALTGSKGFVPFTTSAALTARLGWRAIYYGANAERDWSNYLRIMRTGL